MEECCCGISGCSKVTVIPVGNGMAVDASLVGGIGVSAFACGGISVVTESVGGMKTTVSRVGEMNVSMRLLCKTSQGVWEYLFVEEGQVYELDGKKVMVRRG